MVNTITGRWITARKAHRCQLCAGRITHGSRYYAQTNVYDGRIYTFKTCQWCEESGVINEVSDWSGWLDEGVYEDMVIEWADEWMRWPSVWASVHKNRPMRHAEHMLARQVLARICGGEGE